MEQGEKTSQKAVMVYPKARWVVFGATFLCRDLLLTLLLLGFVSTAWAQEKFKITPQLPKRILELPKQTEKLKLKLTLSVAQTSITVGNRASFNAAFTPFTPQGSIRYTLWINGKAITQWQEKESYSHRFEKPGDFQVHVTANFLQREIRSNEISIAVTKPQVVNGSQADIPQYNKPTANILQQNLTRPQGREALFQASYQIDRRLKIAKVRWSGPIGESDNPNSFVVPTQDLKPGTYTIRYTIWDSYRQAAEAVAQLHIVTRPTAAISPKALTLSQGEQARFEARHQTDRKTKIVTTRWSGPTGESKNPNSFVVPTQDLKPGTYTIRYTIRDSQRQTAEAVAQLHIVERPRASISPKILTLSQGKSARFEGSYHSDRRLKIIKARWDGPMGVSDNSKSFLVSTDDLQPGTYTIHYSVWDERKQVAEAEAELNIVEPPAVRISPKDLTLSQGEEARFQVSYQYDRRLKIDKVRWSGPAGESDKPNGFIVPTDDLDPGTYPIRYSFRDSQGQIAEAIAELHIVARPTALISPGSLTLSQGEEAHFQGRSHIDKKLKIVEIQWDGPVGVKHDTESYTVPTGDLEPSTYPIHYQIRDSQGQIAEAQAELHIIATPLQQLSAEILPNPLNVIQGEEAEFHVANNANPELEVESQWNGPAGSRVNVDIYTVPTEELSPGTYTIRYTVRDAQGRVAESESVLHIAGPDDLTNG